MGERLRAEHVSTTLKLQDWSRRLDRFGRYRADPIRRFALGMYQLYQATDWVGTDSEHESNAAAAIHIIAACEALNIPLEEHLGDKRLVDIEFGSGSVSELLYHLSKLNGQLVYATNHSGIRRKGRFEKSCAANSERHVVNILLGRIPAGLRSKALYEAMEIMQGVL